jgi:hypothetical protein
MTEPSAQYLVALFRSVSHAIYAERILKEADVPHKVIPVPRAISPDCGVCIRFLPEHSEDIENMLTGKVETYSIYPL